VPAVLGVAALLLAVIGCVLMITHEFAPGLVAVIFAIFVGLCAFSYLYTTLRGKFVWWADLLDDARLKGDEYAVDLGCGRGAVLVSLAKRLTTGRVSGIDLWRSHDQSGNDIEATKHNARVCGVEDRVELNTGNITTLPYHDAQFDLVVSSLPSTTSRLAKSGGRRSPRPFGYWNLAARSSSPTSVTPRSTRIGSRLKGWSR